MTPRAEPSRAEPSRAEPSRAEPSRADKCEHTPTCPVYIASTQEHASARPACEPAPTVMFGHRMNDVRWVVDRRTNSKAAGGGMAPTVPVSTDRPAPTFTSKSGTQWVIRPEAPDWTYERPATTIVGSFSPDVVAAPGYRLTESRQQAEASVRVTVAEASVRVTVAEASVRVTVAEASVLQSFRRDYPWQGSRSKQFEQVGNAVPPLLAAHVLSAVTGIPLSEVAA